MAAAFFVAAFLVPILHAPAERMGLVDRPGGRKHHDGLIPLTGGLAIFGGFCFGLLLVDDSIRPFASLIVGMGLMLVTGLVDDLIDISPSAKLSAQVLAAILMVSWGEVQVHSLGTLVGVKPIILGEWAIPFTVLCVLVLVNALNMADGTDGLAGGLVAVALGMFMAVGSIGGASRSLLAVIGVLLVTVVAFLIFNLRYPGRRKARIFLGDSGSLMLGFALAWLAVYLSQGSRGVSVYPVTIAWILVLPVLDVLTLYLRRILKGRSPFSADREHLHHVLLRSGFGPATTVWVLLFIMAAFGLVGLYGWHQQWPEWVLFIGLAPLFFVQYLCSIRAWRVIKVLKRARRRLQ